MLTADEALQRVMLRHGLEGRRVAGERLHITLHWLGDHAEFPAALARHACLAGTRMVSEPFDVVLDRIGSIGDAYNSGPLVLSGGGALAALRGFQRELGEALRAVGIEAFERRSFKPHMTLLYTPTYVAREPVAPVAWTVSELLLIDSHIGQVVHEVVGRWPLAVRQLSLGG